MEMKCHRRTMWIPICICIMVFFTGCGKVSEIGKDAVLQEKTVGRNIAQNEHDEGNNVEDAVKSAYEYYIQKDGSVKILKYMGNEAVVFIPEKLEGQTVSVIGKSAFQNNGQMIQTVLPAGIVAIEDQAFEGCSLLQYVFLNKEIKEIGYRAFGDCVSLEEISFPEGMTDLEAGICEGCTSLEKIVLPKSLCYIDENAFGGCIELQLIYGESEFAEAYAKAEGKVYVDFGRIREEGNQVW